MDQDISTLTGQSNYSKAPSYLLNEISVQGGDPKRDAAYPIEGGKIKMKFKTVEPDDKKGYKAEDIGSEADVVFLKIRRKLSQYRKGQLTLQTNEHTSAYDQVLLFGDDGGTKTGKAMDLRKEYQGLRTQQIVYVYFPARKEVCRLLIKGSSLGSESKADGVLGFYDYLSQFNNDGQHVHEYFTKLKAIPESDYYTMTFERGAKLSADQQKKVNDLIKDVHAKVQRIDTYYADKIKQLGGDPEKAAVAEAEIKTIEMGDDEENVEYPAENINPEDIPF